MLPERIEIARLNLIAGQKAKAAIAFDLAAVLKASQAISIEIELDQLLHSLMQILIEIAGAQTGCLILGAIRCLVNHGNQSVHTHRPQRLKTRYFPMPQGWS